MFAATFLGRFGLEGNMAYVQQQRRILLEIEGLRAEGYTKYEAILKLCSTHKISFKIHENSKSNVTVKTFMDRREWTHLSLEATKEKISEKLGAEIANMLQTKYTNLIIIERSTKN